ncbi:MAG TPA: pyrroloquinoline quinone-dependent dehydrogenase [Steroidobacteraceae bacterium]|jgi:quinoprotein glucose dehydrogenase|nr:pyrroloquinoline quinone-dependent dehydrogenase [Steroidobacteraceae bacterium]
MFANSSTRERDNPSRLTACHHDLRASIEPAMKPSLLVAVLLISAFPLALAHAATGAWAYYGHDPGGTRYSTLAQIAPANVGQLKQIWEFHTGDVSEGSRHQVRSGLETTPLFLDGRLFLTSSFNRIIALDPATGRQLWAYDPSIRRRLAYGDGFTNRGLAAWQDPKESHARCALRLFEATQDARLVAVDALTGIPCVNFGAQGQIDLSGVRNYRAGSYHMTSPPIVVDGVVVVGSSISDNQRVDMPDGVVRGFDARTGKLLWSWEPLKRPAGVPTSAWRTGAGNAWSILSADPKRHLVYVPTGSASPDYYGGLRPGDDRWADSVVALDSRTGRLVWGFQLVHHDLWDYDTAAAPLVTTVPLNGRPTPVLIAGNKTGMIYVLDPRTGQPVLPVEERAVPASTLTGEATSPTQPFPTRTPVLARQSLTAADAWGLTPADRNACKTILSNLTGTTVFSPPSTQGSLAVPGNIGGINWSGFAWDARHERLIVAASDLPYRVQMIPAAKFGGGARGDFRGDAAPETGSPYAMQRAPLESPSGLPCSPPPWGEIVAVDLASGRIAWRQPVGSMQEVFGSRVQNIPGSVMLGGPIVTASGLIFVGGTMDRRFHALSAATGRELWSATLPASAQALPITYQYHGRQYVVIAAGGDAEISEELRGDALIAFALPSSQ